ncbi:GNAT family N-acetyltransferase [Candidatus Micrarchaeota archaeon]|jgi:N-acetylglutamate synthase-like GNAT family acetyltransferase|nr:GNAT family N-acetyltransferase [Candidatus Micrarchaeota archaeon]
MCRYCKKPKNSKLPVEKEFSIHFSNECIQVSKLSISDHPEVIRISEQHLVKLFLGKLPASSFEKPFEFLVAKKEGKVVGWIRYLRKKDSYTDIMVAVDENYYRIGIGRRLVSYIINSAEDEGITNLTCEIEYDNKGSLRLFEGLGFRKISMEKEFYKLTFSCT